jgi:hypothetical protein
MFATAEKSAAPSQVMNRKPAGAFFRKAANENFFGTPTAQPFFQPKLEVSHPEDAQEKEADSVAENVMRMEEPSADVQRSVMVSARAPVSRLISRQEGPGGFASNGPSEDEGADVHVAAKAIMRSRGPPSSSDATQHQHDRSFEQGLTSSRGAGSPLPDDTRQSMESRFGADFSGVRIHTGSQAEGLSKSISAQAFTHGNDIYFNAAKFSPNTATGSQLLAHELTHTIQQGASQRKAEGVAAKLIQTKSIDRSVQRLEAGAQRNAAVELAKAEQGKVSANEEGPDGQRMGWERLIEYFKTTFGADKILPSGAAFQQGYINEAQLKKKSLFKGDVPGGDGIKILHNQDRDAMPSWCGIFAFWALNKGGIPLRKWTLGTSMIPPEAAYPPAHQPQAGDLAYRREFSHYALVASSDGATVTSVNGNTAGDDNLGGQIQVQTHPKDHWFGFFDPTLIMEGSLRDPGSPDAAGAAPVRSLKELRQKLFKVNRKSEQAPASNPAAPAAASPSPEAVSAEKKEHEQEQEREQPASSSEFDVHRSFAGGKQPAAEAPPPSSRHDEAPAPSQAAIAVEAGCAPCMPAAPQLQSLDVQSRGPPRAPPAIQSFVNRKVQRDWLGDAWDAVSSVAGEAAAFVEQGLDAAKEWLLDKVRDFVSNIPGYRMLCLILGEDPITGAATPLTGASLLEAGLDLLPLGHMFRALMTRLGIYEDVALWLEGRIVDVSNVVSGIGSRFASFWDSLSLDDVGDPDGVLRRVGDLLRSTVEEIVGFITRSAIEFLEMIKRVMIREIADFVRAQIPRLYPLLTVALGFDPATNQTVARNGTNILNAFLEISEDGQEQRKQMMETGTFQRIAGWVDRGIVVFTTAYVLLRAAISGIWDFVTVENLFSPLETFQRIWGTFAEPVSMVGQFLIDAAIEILKVIKDAILGRLSAYARQTRGFFLVCVIIGEDPFTNAKVPRTVHNLVKGFMSLMDGGEQQYEQLRESGAIDRIVAKVEAAVDRLNMTPAAIIQLFIDLWNSFSIRDLAHPIEAFQRIVATFGAPILRLIRFVIEIIMIVVEAILILMNFPFDLIGNIIAKARQAFEMIKRDPVGFLKNLLAAIKQGFIQFFDNIGTHLLNGLVGWLMGELRDAGVPTLSDFSLRGVIGWVLEVLGISMEKIWEKLAAHPRIGPAKVAKIRSMINTLEGIWTFIKDVQERGMAAIWDKIQEQLSKLWDTVLDAVKSWIMEKIITAVVTKLLSMLDPTGIMAVINSAIAIYRAVQSFIRYITQMLQVVNSFVEGVVEIAEGSIARAASFLEGAMDRAMPIVIGFLANQVGLGGVGQKVGELIGKARELVDQALTWLVNKAVDTGLALIDRAVAAGKAAVAAVKRWLGLEKKFEAADGKPHRLFLSGSEDSPVLMVESNPTAYSDFLKSVKVADTDTKKTASKEKAVEIAGKIDKRKAEKLGGDTEEAKEKAKAAKVADVLVLLDELAIYTKDLFGDPAEAGEPKVDWPAQHGLYGKSMTAVRLNKKQTLAGTGPTSKGNDSYAILNQRRKPGNPEDAYYVKGHLLNQSIGGKGEWNNLTPLSKTGNSNHESSVESKMKAAFHSGAIIEYNVTAEYGWGDNDSVIPNTDPDAAVKKAIIAEEKNVPRRLQCTASVMEKVGDEFKAKDEIKLSPVENTIEQTAESYVLAGSSTTKTFEDLEKEAKEILKTDTPETWATFKTKDKVHENSMALLSADQKASLEKLFIDRFRIKDKKEELKRITDMGEAKHIQTWIEFKATRVFFDIEDASYKEVESAFNEKQKSLKATLLASAKAAIPGTPVDMTWEDFKKKNGIKYKATDDDKTQLDELETMLKADQKARVRRAALAAAAAAAPTAPAEMKWGEFINSNGINFKGKTPEEQAEFDKIKSLFDGR